VEIAKEVFQRRARAKEKLPHMRGQRNTGSRGNRQGDGPANNIDINPSRDERTFNYKERKTPDINNIPRGLPNENNYSTPKDPKGNENAY
jgi:hypothetical protein